MLRTRYVRHRVGVVRVTFVETAVGTTALYLSAYVPRTCCMCRLLSQYSVPIWSPHIRRGMGSHRWTDNNLPCCTESSTSTQRCSRWKFSGNKQSCYNLKKRILRIYRYQNNRVFNKTKKNKIMKKFCWTSTLQYQQKIMAILHSTFIWY